MFFGVLWLCFIQTLTLWLESMYKISLTRLAPGPELFGLLFAASPLLVLVCPEPAQRKVLGGAVIVFLIARAVAPMMEVTVGALVSGVGVGAFLIALCLLLAQPFRCLQGDAGSALGLALLGSLALRAWGATYDCTLGRSGAVLGWGIVGVALGLFWNLFPRAEADSDAEKSTALNVTGPVLGLFASLAIVYLVLSSPGVVEAWLGFENGLGTRLCITAVGGAALWRARGNGRVSRPVLVVWNLLFALALVGGLLALRISFPATPEAPAVVVKPHNPTAQWLLNLMFVLSPVVLWNVAAASRSLKSARARSLAMPVGLGFALLILLTLLSIFTNVWGYVPPISAVFRNQFHLPFFLLGLLMTAALLLPGWQHAFSPSEPARQPNSLVGLMAALLLVALTGTWYWQRHPAKVVGSPKQLTILTYNMQQGAGWKGNRNWEAQLALLKELNADLIGLQESDTARPSNGNVCAANYLGAKLGYHIYHGPNTVSGTYGTAILSRFPLRNPRTFFTFSDQDEIGTAVAEFEIGGKTFAFFNSHPAGNLPSQRQAEELVRQARPYEYVIAVGDYNATPQAESYRMVAAHLKDAWKEKYPDGVGRLHPVLRPQGWIRPHPSSGELTASGEGIALPGRIDHIFLSQPFQVIEAFYLPAPAAQTDHPAHWAVVAWE